MRTKIVITLILSALLVSCLFLLSSPAEFSVQNKIKELENKNESLFVGIRDNLPQLIKDYGIEGVYNITKQGFVETKMGIYQCHVLMHSIGHEAVVYYNYDFEKVVANSEGICELGYRHGAEAQIVLSGDQYVENMHDFCDTLRVHDPDSDCFHGAGHAFMNNTLDTEESLTLCDTLATEEKYPVQSCYNAVFAELTNLVGGSDGATGMPYTSGPPITLDVATPIDYCSTLSPAHRYQCVFEFSGLGVHEKTTPEEIEVKLLGCIEGDYEEELEAGCIKSVSAVGAQHELAYSETVTVPGSVFSITPALRQAYIEGAGIEMFQYIKSGSERDWNSFCANFTDDADLSYCKSLFEL